MTTARKMDDLSTLSNVLLSNIDERIFFSNLCEFILHQTREYKVKVFECFDDGATRLISENGKPIFNAPISAKGEGLAGYVFRTKRIYYSNAVKRDPLLSGSEVDTKVESELCVPVINESTVMATIHIQSADPEKRFNEEDGNEVLEMLKKIEKPLSNMKMYLLAKHLNERLLKEVEEREKKQAEVTFEESYSILKENIHLIAISPEMKAIIDQIRLIAREDLPVLIQGDLGTGKRTISKKIHIESSRKDKAFSVIDCKLQDTHLEAEIFGRGEKKGVIESSSNGTVVFHDIDCLSPILQNRVLKFLTTGSVIRTGEVRPIPVNVRVISTTRKDLSTEVKEGRLHEDLFYRLNTVSVKIPGLRERKDDIKVLAEYFLNEGRNLEESKVLTSKALDVLLDYEWPGNVQELKNVVERIFALTDGRFIDEENLPDEVKERNAEVSGEFSPYEEITIHELEKRHIIRTLDFLGGNKTKAAKSLGITVKTLYNKLHSYGLVKTKF